MNIKLIALIMVVFGIGFGAVFAGDCSKLLGQNKIDCEASQANVAKFMSECETDATVLAAMKVARDASTAAGYTPAKTNRIESEAKNVAISTCMAGKTRSANQG